jgi:hypothetical protein
MHDDEQERALMATSMAMMIQNAPGALESGRCNE